MKHPPSPAELAIIAALLKSHALAALAKHTPLQKATREQVASDFLPMALKLVLDAKHFLDAKS